MNVILHNTAEPKSLKNMVVSMQQIKYKFFLHNTEKFSLKTNIHLFSLTSINIIIIIIIIWEQNYASIFTPAMNTQTNFL